MHQKSVLKILTYNSSLIIRVYLIGQIINLSKQQQKDHLPGFTPITVPRKLNKNV